MYLPFLLQVIVLVSCQRKITINNQNSGSVFTWLLKEKNFPSFIYNTSDVVSWALLSTCKTPKKGAFLNSHNRHNTLFMDGTIKTELFRDEKEKSDWFPELSEFCKTGR